MQATGTLREAGVSKRFILVVIAMVCALILGAAGGYAARSTGSGAGAVVQSHSAVDANQGDPRSDLTRAQPTEAPVHFDGVPDAGYTP